MRKTSRFVPPYSIAGSAHRTGYLVDERSKWEREGLYRSVIVVPRNRSGGCGVTACC